MDFLKPALEDDLLNEQGAEGAGATFSRCRKYRYHLYRRTGPGELLTFVMLNPSTADALKLDPTLRKCMGFAQRHGYAGISVLNLFALRSTDPKGLNDHADAVGSRGVSFLRSAAGDVCLGWGNIEPRGYRGWQVRILQVLQAVPCPRLHYLKLNKGGAPRHPLYISYSERLKPWERED